MHRFAVDFERFILLQKNGHMSHQFDKEGQILRFGVERLLPYDRILAAARTTGFCHRIRKIHPVLFLQVVLFAPCLHSHATVAEIWRTYRSLTESDIAYSSFVDRLDDSASRFFKVVLDECIQSSIGNMALELQERYARFVTVFIQDSTIIRVNKKLADKFPAARTRRVAAGLKIPYVLNVLTNGPHTISIVPERTAEAKTLRLGPWIAGSLLLLDLGFYGYNHFARIHENRGFFVSRVKEGSKLTIKEIHSKMAKEQRDALVEQDLPSVIAGLPIKSIDATITVQLKRRRYNGKQRKEAYSFRCVGKINPSTGKWHLYLTNLKGDDFTVDEIAELYRFRWEIESLFDEAKNECTLGDVGVKREGATKALLLAMLIRQVVLRRVYLVLRTLVNETIRQRFSRKLYGRVFIEQIDLLLEIVIDEWRPPGEQMRGRDGWSLWFDNLSRNSLQYHPKKLVRDTILKR